MDTAHHFDDLLTHRDRAAEDGHGLPPSGQHDFTVEMPRYGLSVECRADFTVYADRLVIDDVQVWDFERKKWAFLPWSDPFACAYAGLLVQEARHHEEAMRQKVLEQ